MLKYPRPPPTSPQLYRIDMGGCGFYDYNGKYKARQYLFEQTNPSDVIKTFQAMSRQDG